MNGSEKRLTSKTARQILNTTKLMQPGNQINKGFVKQTDSVIASLYSSPMGNPYTV